MYRAEEIKYLLDNYIDLQTKRTRPYIQVRLLDLQVAMNRIPVTLREAAFYLGVAQLTLREAGELLNVPYTRLGDRYRYAIDEILVRLNEKA